MAVVFDNDQLKHVATMQQVQQAAQAGSALIALWPLSTAQRLGNDAKYTENLQVRVTWAAARVLTGQDVTLADAEFVYEGATDIPGRPQEVVDALLAVNDAYERLEDYSRTGDVSLVMTAAEELNSGWSESAAKAVAATLERIEACVPDCRGDGSSEVGAVSRRLAFVIAASTALLVEVSDYGKSVDDPLLPDCVEGEPKSSGVADISCQQAGRRAAVLMLYLNELCERVILPRLALTDVQFCQIVEECAEFEGASPSVEAVAEVLAPLAQAEWVRHHDEIVFDPVAAKKAASEKEEQRKKAALAEKFKDVPEDKNKPPVEL
ncbi:hypothetical protein GA0061078_0817 [Bifidobacterium bohemicum]|uniref:Uncharacterized protein n=1 Tax=Bifidobacterium bohemicum DSM 22767 TaxID=1437606 RepID=A0A086ZF18_9BIFI|nr:hypothetical protein [Bifidobacterium bohemicum]KFI45118.1 hypothetical protein BBOH_1380 [Bifidobacterium bohemicum DSM 22767]SCB91097.1 hypothetical protein GA0061078_0817 [Bifidobacterium bohemicum]